MGDMPDRLLDPAANGSQHARLCNMDAARLGWRQGQPGKAAARYPRVFGNRAAQRLHPRDREPVGYGAVPAEKLEAVAEGGELDRTARRDMVERVAHLLLRHRAQLRWAKAFGVLEQAADGNLADAVVKAHAKVVGVERDRAALAYPGRVEAAVILEAERCERAQGVVVRAEIPGAKSDGARRTRPGQHVAGEPDQSFLRCERKVADVAPRHAAHRVQPRKPQPFGMNVELDLVSAADDWLDDRFDDFRTEHEGRHRIDEEHALEAEAVEHVHLEM